MEWVAVIAMVVAVLQFLIYGKQKKKFKAQILKEKLSSSEKLDEQRVREDKEKRKVFNDLKKQFFKGDPGDSDHTSGNC